MDIRLPNLEIEARKGCTALVIHQDINWDVKQGIPMTEENDSWILRDVENHIGPQKQFLAAILGLPNQSEAFSVYCLRDDAGLYIGGPPINHPDNPDLKVKKLFWDEGGKVMFLMVPGFDVYITPGGKWHNRMPLAQDPAS